MAFATVEGSITRTFFNGKGAEVTETFKKQDGSEGKSRYSLWFKEPHNLSEGDAGKWSGALSVKVEPWTDRDGNERQSAKVSLNGARTVTGGQQSPAHQSQAPADEPWNATPQTPAGDVWNTPGSFNDETPF